MKTNLDKHFKTIDAAVRLELAPGVAFHVRQFKAESPNFKAAMARHWKPYARQIENGTLDAKKATEIQARLFVETCLVDWEGIEIDGKEVAFNDLEREKKVQFFVGLPELFDTLWRHAQDYKNYKEELDDLGNS